MNSKKFVVGDSVTLVDCLATASLDNYFRFTFNAQQRKTLGHLTTYLSEKSQAEIFKEFLRPMNLGEAEFPHIQVDLKEEKRKADEEKKKIAEEKKRK